MATNRPASPNILFILTDQQRTDTLSAYGGGVCHTPSLDALAKESVVFTNAYCPSPICSPARATLQTGLYPHKHGIMTNIYSPGSMVHELADGPDLLGRRLGEQGYSVGYTGKWHLGTGSRATGNPRTVRFPDYYFNPGSLPTSLGYEGDDFPGHGGGGENYPQFRECLAERGLSHDLANPMQGSGRAAEITSPVESTVSHFLVDRAIHYIDTFRQRPQPFFFALNFWGPHEPYYAPTRHLDLYRNLKLEPWPSFHESQERKPSIHGAKRAGTDDWSFFEPFIKHYYALTTLIDEEIGRLLEYLKRSGIYDETVVIFTADHGESLGIHGGLTDKSLFMYEETCRVPLLIKPAGEKPATQRRERRLVNGVDLYPTLLGLAGLSRAEAERDGRSLVPLLADEVSEDWPDHTVVQGSGIGGLLFSQRMIRCGDLKYVFNCGDNDELYDLSADPHELVNRIDDTEYSESLLGLRRKLAVWMENQHDGLLGFFRRMRTVI